MADEHLISLQPGTVIAGRYEVVKCLGSGSMGLVYACRHRELSGHLVAAKVLYPEVAKDRVAAARFRNEIFASYDVSHPNVVRAYEYVRDGDLVAYTMEYVGGGDLATRLSRQNEPIPISEVTRYLAQMCSGVQAIHDAGIVHRDLKPENIFLTKEGNIKIGDFGIAKAGHGPKLTEHGGVVGTIDYVSPEYMLNSQVDWRSDIYAIGILGYEMLVGESPFRGDSVYATMTKRLKSDPNPPSSVRSDCPKELDRIVLRAMHRNLEERYQSGKEMYEDLRAAFPDWVTSIPAGSSTARQSAAIQTPRANIEREPVAKESPSFTNENSRFSGASDRPSGSSTRGPEVSARADLRSAETVTLFDGIQVSAPSSARTSQGFSEVQGRGRASAGPTSVGREDVPARIRSQSSMEMESNETREVFTPNFSRVSGRYTPSNSGGPQPVRMNRVLAYNDLVSTGGREMPPSPRTDSGVSLPRGEDDRIRRLSAFVDSANRSVWVDAVTLVVAVLIGVGVGFFVLRVYFPDMVDVRAAPQDSLELP